MLKNAIVLVALVVVSSAYLWVSPSFMPAAHAITVIVNIIVAPLVFGLLAGYLLTGRVIFKLPILLLIPIAHVLLFGGDPAKPGLENFVALIEFVPLCIGCLVAHMLLRKKAASETA